MRNTLVTVTMLAVLAGTPAFVRARDTNSPGGSAKAAVKPYPLNYCLVSGDKIGEMGKPITNNYMGQQIIFCCPDCPKEFKKNPDKYMKQLAEAQKQAAPDKK
jgi:YHS domain-containing protein